MSHVKRYGFLGETPQIYPQMGGSIGQIVEVQTKKSGLQMGQR